MSNKTSDQDILRMKSNVEKIAAFILVFVLLGSLSHVAYAQLWYNTQTDSAIECSDDEPGNPSPGPDMLGCPYDFMKHVGGFTELVGSWHIIIKPAMAV